MKPIDEIFGKHFNGLHYADITKDGILKFAEDYVKIHHESEVKKLNIAGVSVSFFNEVIDFIENDINMGTDDYERDELFKLFNER